MFQYTGEYIKSKTIYGSEIYTFTPTPLCKNLSIDVDNELLSLLTTANKLLGVLEGMVAFLPDQSSVQKLMCLKECCHSIRIDYRNSLGFRDALKRISSRQDELGIISNFATAHQYAYDKSAHGITGHSTLKKRFLQ